MTVQHQPGWRKIAFLLLSAFFLSLPGAFAQMLALPDAGVNHKCLAGRRIGVTDIEIHWNSPGVKGREGKIWGTPVAHYGFTVLGFGSYTESPWRAGANECTTVSFSTDVMIEGKKLPAGKYAFFIALYPDSCTLIFSKNTTEWGSYFYKSELDVLRVTVRQQKNLPQSRERLDYTFADHTDRSVVVALEWEYWRIPFKVEVDLKSTTLASIQSQLSGAMGFDPPSLIAGAQWCLNNDVNLDEALVWVTTSTDPNLGGVKSFSALSTQAGLHRKKGNNAEADKIMATALDNATVMEMHGYGRQLLNQKKYKEAMGVFEKNFQKNGDTWPTHVGLMRGYSAVGDLKNALKHAKIALGQAPDDVNKRNLEASVKMLEEGKALAQ